MRAILAHETFKYIDQSAEHYHNFIISCQFLRQKEWIEWGTSIRGCWFDEYLDNKEIIDGVPFSIDNIATLIEFIENAQ